jgi:hypothetical protein
MAQVLKLEYICTQAERSEAQTLGLRQQLGRGSKWRTRVVLFAILFGVVLGFYFEVRQSWSDPVMRYALGGALVFACGFVFWKRRAGRGAPTTTRVEISEAEVTVVVGAVKITTPWSGFGDCLESPNLFVLVDRPKTLLTILPKRVFPTESWQSWFRNLANHRPRPEERPQSAGAPLAVSPERSTLQFRLGVRDYVDRALASFRTWGLILGVAGMILGLSISAGMHPSPHAVYSATQVYFMFMLPTTLLMAVMIIAIASVYPWFLHRRLLTPQEVSLTADAITCASADGDASVPWTAYARYKETRRSFILWKGQVWMLVPKRAFASAEELDRCRALFATHLERSRWFFG